MTEKTYLPVVRRHRRCLRVLVLWTDRLSLPTSRHRNLRMIRIQSGCHLDRSRRPDPGDDRPTGLGVLQRFPDPDAHGIARDLPRADHHGLDDRHDHDRR